MDIILYLLTIFQYLYQMNCWLFNFIVTFQIHARDKSK